MTSIVVFAKSQTVDVEIAPPERNKKGRIVEDNAYARHNRYEHRENTILFVTLYQTTISSRVDFTTTYELIKELVCNEWCFIDFVDLKLIRDIGSTWSFYLTLQCEDYFDNYVFTSAIECEVIST